MRQPRFLVSLIVLFGLVAVLLPSAQAQEGEIAELSIYRVYVEDQGDIQFLFDTGVDVLEARGDNYLLILSNEAVVAKLEADGYRIRKQQDLDPLTGVPGFMTNDRFVAMASTYNGGYRTVDEHYNHLANVAASFPALATVVDYGDSWRSVNSRPGGNELLAICLTDMQPGDCDRDPASAKPRALVMAAIHARELQTSEVAWRLIDELTQGYGIDPDITNILNTTEVWIIPVANPDGREIAELGGNAPYLQRKNANDDFGSCSVPPTLGSQHGVDLNRNASWQWGGAGTTAIPCWATYRGTGAASEPEQAALEALFRDLWPDQKGPIFSPAPDSATGLFISVHSYGELILFPPGAGGTTPNDIQLRTLAFRMGHYNQYRVGTGPEILYPATGTTDDWAYGQLGVASFTYELSPMSGACGGFTPPYDCIDASLWPRNRDALLYGLKVASAPFVTPRGPTTETVSSPAPVSQTAGFQLDAQIDDDAFGNAPGSVNRPAAQAITQAEYYIDVGPHQGGIGTAMLPADGTFGSTSEAVTSTVSAAALTPGEHTVLVRGRNSAGFWGPLTATTIEVVAGPTIVSPADGAEVCAGDAIDWDGPTSGKYRLRIGTTPDGADVLNQATTTTELTVGTLPAGSLLFVTLRHRATGETSWVMHDEVLAVPCSAQAITIVSPVQGAELCAGDTIDWDGPTSGKYRLRIGTTPDGADVLNQATTTTELTVGPLPPGQPLYLSLRHRPAGETSWVMHDEVLAVPCSAQAITIVSPVQGAELCAGDTIDWDGPTSGKYRLRIGTTPDGADVLNQATTTTELTVGPLPPGQPLYLTLRHRPAGETSWTAHDQIGVNSCA